VVKACIENGAHYIDLCGEPQVLTVMLLSLFVAVITPILPILKKSFYYDDLVLETFV